jgi:hypothetical protein
VNPLSVTSAVVGLTFQCTKLVFQVKAAYEKYQAAPKALTILEDECRVVGAVLSHLSSVLASSPALFDKLDGEGHLYIVFLYAVQGTEVLLQCIDAEFNALMRREDWTARLTTLWKEQTMTDFVHNWEEKKETSTS